LPVPDIPVTRIFRTATAYAVVAARFRPRGSGAPDLRMAGAGSVTHVTPDGDTLRMSVEVVFETHSLSVDNEQGLATGWSPGHLSSRGRRLAIELGDRRREDGLSAVFTSDLRRAVETAEIAFAGTTIPIFSDARLRECDYGEMTGMPASMLERERPLRVDRPFPGGESWRQAVERVRDFLQELVQRHPDERVLVIGHVATRWALDHYANGASLRDLVRTPFDWREGWVYTLSPDALRERS
jgi:broad specificity phosphatase PhoE